MDDIWTYWHVRRNNCIGRSLAGSSFDRNNLLNLGTFSYLTDSETIIKWQTFLAEAKQLSE